MSTRFGPQFHFGTGYDESNLPDGWTCKQTPVNYVVATDKDGNEYYMSEDLAYPKKTAGPDNAFMAEGTSYVDTDNPVVLNPCPHGNLAHECNDCMIEGDFQYDAAREGR